jgi:hypothetical protein
MPLGAKSFSGIDRGKSFPSHDVFSASHWFQMVRISAQFHAAKVIELSSFRDFPYQDSVDSKVCDASENSIAPQADMTVSRMMFPLPNPAGSSQPGNGAGIKHQPLQYSIV